MRVAAPPGLAEATLAHLRADPADASAWEALRLALFPGDRINLSPGGLGTPSTAVLAAQERFWHGGRRAWPLGQYTAGREALREARAAAEALWGGTVSVTAGTTQVMNLLMLAALTRQEGPLRVLTGGQEHYGGIGGLQRHPRCEVYTLPQATLADAAALSRSVEATGAHWVLLSQVTWPTGQVLPVEPLHAALSALPHPPLLVVDAAQALGLLPPPREAADVVVASGHKWLFGPPGTGLLWRSPRAVEAIGPLSWAGEAIDGEAPGSDAEVAGGQDFSLYAGLEAALTLLAALGPHTVAARSRLLSNHLRDRLVAAFTWRGHPVHVPFDGPHRSPGTFAVELGALDAYPLYRGLDASGIHVKCVKRVDGDGQTQNLLRFGVPFYESLARLDRVADAVDAWLVDRGPRG